MIFEWDEGQVYGTPTLETDATIPSGKCLEIPTVTTLTIDNNVTLTNNGVIGVYGTISGSLTNNGTIMVGPDGSIPETVPGTGSVVRYPSNRTYLDEDGTSKPIPTGTKFLLPGMTALSGWYVVFGNVILPECPTVTGDVHLILVDGCKLDAQKGIIVEGSNSLTIYAQSNGSNMGKLTATGYIDQAGIGGGWGGNGGTFITGTDGNAFITASSISDNDDTADWSGVIFVEDKGRVYNSPIALDTDATIPAGKELVIESGETLTIGKGVTLTNEGTLTIESGGTLVNNGKLVNNSRNLGITGGGTIQGTGELTGDGTIDGNITTIQYTKPAITVQPEDKSVSIGQRADFRIVFSGTPAPTCRWQVNSGSGWKDIPGAATSSYTTEAASMSMNGWQYRCVVTNGVGSATSDPATLTVQKATPPAATPQHLNIANHLEKTYTVLLPNLRPQLPEGADWKNVTYELTSVNFTETGYYTAGTAEIIRGPSGALNTLSLPILFNDVTTEGKVGTVTVTIRSDNYRDFTNTIEVSASNKEADRKSVV